MTADTGQLRAVDSVLSADPDAPPALPACYAREPRRRALVLNSIVVHVAVVSCCSTVILM
jgi:hypothetical protein